MFLVKILSYDDPPVTYWLTRPDWTSPSPKSSALSEPKPVLNGDAIADQKAGLRADTLLTIARRNLSNSLSFHVREQFSSAAAAGYEASKRWTESMPIEGIAVLIWGVPGGAPQTTVFDQVAIKNCTRELNGKAVVFGYTLVGGRIYDPDGPVVLIGQGRTTMTFNFAGALKVGQIGGLWTPDQDSSVIGFDLCVGAPADADIAGSFLDGDGADLGIPFVLPAGKKMAHVALDPEVVISAGTSVVPVLSSVGSADASGENLLIQFTARQ